MDKWEEIVEYAPQYWLQFRELLISCHGFFPLPSLIMSIKLRKGGDYFFFKLTGETNSWGGGRKIIGGMRFFHFHFHFPTLSYHHVIYNI